MTQTHTSPLAVGVTPTEPHSDADSPVDATRKPATRKPAPRTPPRLLLRTFWTAQRTAYRVSKGRIGLRQPESGKHFGMLRLATVGRRSGRTRVAILGYIEDGSNLVTIAMNGWGQTEPAWWLNLQGNSSAVVDLVDGSRAVRGRLATGEERTRLWARFADFPGWGEDLDTLAGRRANPTAVVVLEPVPVDGTSRSDAVPPTFTKTDSRALSSVQPLYDRRRRLRPRHLWLVPGLGLALLANAQASRLGVGLVPLLVFGIGPDLPRAIGLKRPTMLNCHNAMHGLSLPVAILLATALTGISAFAFVGAIAWIGHIVVGWATGDRRRPTGNAPGSLTARAIDDAALGPQLGRLSGQ